MNGFLRVDKDAESVLKCIISKSDNNFDTLLNLSYRDFKNPKFTNSFINSICHELLRKGYIEPFYESHSSKNYIQLQLTHEGYSYFQSKRKENFRTWFPIIISSLAQ